MASGAVRIVKDNDELIVEQLTFLGIMRFKWIDDKVYTQSPADKDWHYDEFMTLFFTALNEVRQSGR